MIQDNFNFIVFEAHVTKDLNRRLISKIFDILVLTKQTLLIIQMLFCVMHPI